MEESKAFQARVLAFYRHMRAEKEYTEIEDLKKAEMASARYSDKWDPRHLESKAFVEACQHILFGTVPPGYKEFEKWDFLKQ